MVTFADWVRSWSNKTPTAHAWWIDYQGELKSFSWQQIEQAVLKVAASFSEKGLVVGDRIVSQLPNSLSWALIDLACNVLGLIHVPVDHRLPMSTLKQIVATTRASLFQSVSDVFSIDSDKSSELGPSKNPDASIYEWSLADPPHLDFERLRVAVEPNMTACILFTSGTTGDPLGAMLSYDNLIQNAWGKLGALPQFSSDRRLNLLPFSHAYARTCELSTWALTGGAMFCVQNIEQLRRLASRFRPTLFNGVPHVFEKWMQELTVFQDIDRRHQAMIAMLGDSMRCLASGGAGLPPDVSRFFKQLGLPIIQGYGLTEASPVVCSNRSDSPKTDSVGPPILNTELRIDDEQRLFVKGPGIMQGYWENTEATHRRIHDGWLDTGDRAEKLPDGTLRILGRFDDRIVLSTGFKIDPMPIEQRLIKKLGMKHCMLVGHNQRYVIAIVVTNLTNESELLIAFQTQLADLPDYCVPKHLIINDREWTEDRGLLNQKGNVRRKSVLEFYRNEIAAVYCSSFGRKQVALNPSDCNKQDRNSNQDGNQIQQ